MVGVVWAGPQSASQVNFCVFLNSVFSRASSPSNSTTLPSRLISGWGLFTSVATVIIVYYLVTLDTRTFPQLSRVTVSPSWSVSASAPSTNIFWEYHTSFCPTSGFCGSHDVMWLSHDQRCTAPLGVWGGVSSPLLSLLLPWWRLLTWAMQCNEEQLDLSPWQQIQE